MFHDALMGAAISGLLAAGCASDNGGDDAPREVGRTEYANLTVAMFKDICEERGGLTQVHASCASTNSCRGLIYNSWANEDGKAIVVEHTCRAFNSCLGISCVDMPADGGKTGQEIYEDTCGGCHAGPEDSEDAYAMYTVFAEPGGDVEAALAEFNARSEATLVNNVAFGAVGFYADGTPYSNMPAYHEELSLAETRRVVEYLLTLEAVGEEIEALGINQEIDSTPDEPQH